MRKRVPRRAGHCLNKHESILRKNGSRGSNMKRIPFWLVVCTTVALAAFAGRAISAQDKYTLQVPDGLSFAEFRGYEDWQVVSISQATIPSIGELIEVILANPVMIEAYRAGIDGSNKPYPDGSKMAKIHWTTKKMVEAPAPTTVPDMLHDVDFMVRDSKRFADSGAWGYAEFDYDAASDTFRPFSTGAKCGFACHTRVAAKDYVFTSYPKR
jgi:hypothetical protein